MDVKRGKDNEIELEKCRPSQINYFDQSPVAIEFFCKNGRLSEANQACLDLFGVASIEAVQAYNLFEDPHLPEQAKIEIREGKSVRYKVEFDFELIKSRNLYQTSRSGVCFMECYITPSFGQDSEINGYIVNVLDISEREKTRDLLIANQETYQTVFNFIAEAIFILDPKTGAILDVNDAMLKLYGYDSKQAALSCTLGDLSSNIGLYNQKKAHSYINKACGEGPQTFEWHARRFDGVLFWIEMTMKETFIGDEKRILAVGRDITNRKHTEEILYESENKYRSLIQYSSDPIFSFNPDYSYRFVNEAFAKPFGKSPEEIIGKTPFDIFSTDEANKRLIIVRQVFLTGEKREIEVRVDTMSGEIKYFLTMADPIKNDSGKVLYVTCVSKDITGRKQAEKALELSSERYRNLIELAVDGVLVGSSEGFIIDANSCICSMSGRTKENLIGLHISDSIFTPESISKKPFDFESLKKGEIIVNERDIIRPDGSILNIEMRTRMMPDGTYQSIIRDISERKQIEAAIKSRNEELSVFNETKVRFLSIIAHDLRNPFNAILGFTKLMLHDFTHLDDETLLTGLRTIESASNHAFKLLENLLTWANNQTGRTQYTPEKLNIKEQIQASLTMIESSAISKEIQFSVQVNKTLHTFADKNMLETILRNLMSNAVKYSYKGSMIKIKALKVENELHISVEDKGVGIPADKISAIFEIDKRRNTLGTDNEQGTGLGLILCKDFIEKHEGKIWVESIPEKGSKFMFSLPSI